MNTTALANRWTAACPKLKERVATLMDEHREFFRCPVMVIAIAPGRIESSCHQDWAGGTTLSGTIGRATLVAGNQNGTDFLEVRSLSKQIRRTQKFAIGVPPSALLTKKRARGHHRWTDYVEGVVYALKKHGATIRGATLTIESDIPMGAGVSSSAALTVSCTHAIAHLNGIHLTDMETINIAHAAESEFCGIPCGRLDQATVQLADETSSLKIIHRKDGTKPFTYEKIPVTRSNFASLIGYTDKGHVLAAEGQYGERRKGTEEAAMIVRKILGKIVGPTDITPVELKIVHGELLSTLGDHARYADYLKYVVDEHVRVALMTVAATCGDWVNYGTLMTHAGEQALECFDLGDSEGGLRFVLDFTRATRHRFHAYTRNMGGGWNASTNTLCPEDTAHDFMDALGTAFEKRFGLPYHFLLATPAPHAGVLFRL